MNVKTGYRKRLYFYVCKCRVKHVIHSFIRTTEYDEVTPFADEDEYEDADDYV